MICTFICHVNCRSKKYVLILVLWCFCIISRTLNIFILFFFKRLSLTLRPQRGGVPTASLKNFYKQEHIFGMYGFYNKSSSLPAGPLPEGLAEPSVILLLLLV